MAKKVYEEANIAAIADKIRENTGGEKTYKTAEMPGGVDEVFDAGHDAGKKAEYDAFWDAFQENGERTDYNFAFYGWYDELFKPKYLIVPSGDARSLFEKSYISQIDEKMISSENATIVRAWFQGTHNLKVAPPLNFQNVSRIISMFFETSVETARIYNVQENARWETTFGSSGLPVKMTNLTIEGVIGQSIDLQWCPLSVASMKSVISCLKDYSTTKPYTYTVTFNADCWAALEADSTSPNGNTWKEYVSDLGWLT